MTGHRSQARALPDMEYPGFPVGTSTSISAICYPFPHKVAVALCGGCKGSCFRLAQWSERAGGNHDFLFLENALPGTHDPATYDDGGRKRAVIAG